MENCEYVGDALPLPRDAFAAASPGTAIAEAAATVRCCFDKG